MAVSSASGTSSSSVNSSLVLSLATVVFVAIGFNLSVSIMLMDVVSMKKARLTVNYALCCLDQASEREGVLLGGRRLHARWWLVAAARIEHAREPDGEVHAIASGVSAW